MRVSKEKAAQNRHRMLIAAARLFRENGIDSSGVDAITDHNGSRRYEEAMATLSCLVGALILARAVNEAAFSRRILEAAAYRVNHPARQRASRASRLQIPISRHAQEEL